MCEYKGYKLLDKIILVSRDPFNKDDVPQAYLVDPSNKKQLESALEWARWTEYIPNTVDEKQKHIGTQYEFDNKDFDFELLDAAGGSTQGGRLSFWNCLISKDGKTFKIGINSDMLLTLLKDGNFKKGKCNDKVCFLSKQGKVGVTIIGSESYKAAQSDMLLKSNFKSKQTSTYQFGDNVVTPTLNEIYLGEIYKYYEVKGEFDFVRWGLHPYISRHTPIVVHKLKTPIVKHLYENSGIFSYYEDKFIDVSCISDITKNYQVKPWSRLNLRDNKTKRTLGLKQITIDCTQKELGEVIKNKWSVFSNYDTTNLPMDCDMEYKLCAFLSENLFGYSYEPFDLDDNTLMLFQKYNIKYLED